MSDAIIIRDLEVWFRVGVPEAERAEPQRLLLTVEIIHDFSTAAAADDLTHTIDYYAVSRRLLCFGENRSWKLIEKLAVDIAEMVREVFHARQVAVEVRKFIIPEARFVAVKVTRRGKKFEVQSPMFKSQKSSAKAARRVVRPAR